MATGLTRSQIYDWAETFLQPMRELAKYGHKAVGRCMVEFIVTTTPELDGTMTFEPLAQLKEELDAKLPLNIALLDLLRGYDPSHDFVVGIMCDGAIVSFHLISQTGPHGFKDKNAAKVRLESGRYVT